MYRGMIVDDASIIRVRLKTILEAYFEILYETDNGLDALLNYKILRPDFVTLDIAMPKMNGIEAMKKILEFHNEAKIIIVSAVGQKKQVYEALAMGAKDFIVKPFEPERVKESVFNLFSNEKASSET